MLICFLRETEGGAARARSTSPEKPGTPEIFLECINFVQLLEFSRVVLKFGKLPLVSSGFPEFPRLSFLVLSCVYSSPLGQALRKDRSARQVKTFKTRAATFV